MELMVNDVVKIFKDKVAVEHVSLTLNEGVWGLLGANGAGKTTLMRMIAGILTPTEGRVLCDGVDIRVLGEKYRSIFGYLPQNFGFYPEFTVYDYLSYVASLKGLNKTTSDAKIENLIDMVGLQGMQKKLVRKLSGGMQRRVGIIQALLNDPAILVLDEPTSGLDPAERVYFRNILSELGQNRIVLISTHIVSDVEYIASQNAIMKSGKLVAVGGTEELVRKVRGLVWQCTIQPDDVVEVEQRVHVVNMLNELDNTVTIRYLGEHPSVEGSVSVEPRFEDLYLWVFRNDTGNRSWKK